LHRKPVGRGHEYSNRRKKKRAKGEETVKKGDRVKKGFPTGLHVHQGCGDLLIPLSKQQKGRGGGKLEKENIQPIDSVCICLRGNAFKKR